jgi:hypothetical protein
MIKAVEYMISHALSDFCLDGGRNVGREGTIFRPCLKDNKATCG